MNKLFVSLAASGMVAATLSAPAFAGNISFDTTGPGSTNTVTSTNCFDYNHSNYNWVGLSNWNNQWSRSGNSWTSYNTKAGGWGGSGNAYNSNATGTNIRISNLSNNGGGYGSSLGNGGRMASIHLTGPDSYNRISYNNHQSYNSQNFNNVGVNNTNSQSANSGNVYVTGNTVVHGAGLGSGNAANSNSTGTSVNIDNGGSGMMPMYNSGGSNSAHISTTGPDSYNSISSNNSVRYNQTNTNNVGITNSNHQQASSGDVVISHNTVVDGFGGSGDAMNTNHTGTSLSLSN
jgi:hypothetical protein